MGDSRGQINFTFCGAPACIKSGRHYHDDTVRGEKYSDQTSGFVDGRQCGNEGVEVVLEAFLFQALESI